MYIIVGLGNPGSRYKYTRHNVGFMVTDILAQRYNVKLDKLGYKALWAETRIHGQKIMLMQPQTFMNDSGISVVEAIRYFNLSLDRLIIIYDDIDLPLGKIRIRAKGSAGTHNGMRSIIYHLKDDNFTRIRIGIGKPPSGHDMVDFVLGTFEENEIPIIYDAIVKAADAVETIIASGVEMAMNRYNVPRQHYVDAEDTSI